MSVSKEWLEQNGKKPTINEVPLSGTGYDRKEMLVKLYNRLNTVAYNAGRVQSTAFSKDAVVDFIKKVQELISDVIEEKPIQKADFRETELTSLLKRG